MVIHVVMWKLKEQAEGLQKDEISLKMKNELESLKQKIEQIKELEVGINFAKSDAAYDILLHSVFRDENDLGIYQNHPEHVKVADYIGKVVEKRVVVDYQK